MVSDVKLLVAAQAAGSSEADRNLFARRFSKFLKHCAGRYCGLYKLDLANVDDVVNMAFVTFFDSTKARFKAGTCVGHLTYLEGLVQNAVKMRWRFVKKGASEAQVWDDPLVVQLGLPTCIEEIEAPETVPPLEVAEQAVIALSVATPDELILVYRRHYDDEPIMAIAVAMGIARTTVTRRLDRYYARARAELAA